MARRTLWLRYRGYGITGLGQYRNKICAVVLYGCETWSLAMREERRLRVFRNRVLRRIFGPKTGEVTGEWRKLHNELNDRTAHQIWFG